MDLSENNLRVFQVVVVVAVGAGEMVYVADPMTVVEPDGPRVRAAPPVAAEMTVTGMTMATSTIAWALVP